MAGTVVRKLYGEIAIRVEGTRATGGPVDAGKSYIVGAGHGCPSVARGTDAGSATEDGPEHFVPKRDGTIIPSGALGGKVSIRSVVENVYITVESARETPAEIKRIVRQGLNELAVELEATLGL